MERLRWAWGASVSSLFRQEVLQAQSGQWLGAINLATPLSFAWWTGSAAAMAIIVLLFLSFGHYTRRATVSGQLEPTAGMLTLRTQSTGTVARALVHEGERVEAGQPLLEVVTGLASASMGDTNAVIARQLTAQEAQVRNTLANLQSLQETQTQDLRTRVGVLRAQMRAIDTQIALQRQQATTAVAFNAKIQPAVDKGVVSVAEFNQFKATALTARAQVKELDRQRLDLRAQLSSLQAQLAQLPFDTETKGNQLRSQLAQLDAQLAQNASAGGTILHAPRAGIVSTLLVKVGQSVSQNQPVLSIVPHASPLEALLLVPSSAIGFVAPGDRVALRYQAFPYQKYGQQYGKVIEVSRSALSPDEIAALQGQQTGTPQYRVVVALDRQGLRADGRTAELRPGMTLSADILLDRRSLWQWVLGPLAGLRQQAGTNGTKAG